MKEMITSLILRYIPILAPGKAGLLSTLLTPSIRLSVTLISVLGWADTRSDLHSMKKYLLTLLLIFSSLSSNAQTSSFDHVTLQELNRESALIWSQLLHSKGAKAAAESLKSKNTLPSEVRALAQRLRQFMISSQVHFEHLSTAVGRGEVKSILGGHMDPLLRHLLVNSLLLDLAVIIDETKPGFLSPDSHRQRVIELYARSFKSADPVTSIRQMLKMTGPNPYEHLTERVRNTALAGLFLYDSEVTDCADVVSLSWIIQARKYIISVSVGPDSTTLFDGKYVGSLNDVTECARDFILTAIKNKNYHVMEKTSSLGDVEYSGKELIKMARNLFGE